jgi:hypothetical protein
MPGYRPPSTEPRGKWANAIHAKRRAEGISQTGAFELLGPRLGLGAKSRAAYVAIDLGSREPTSAEALVLAEWLGGYPPDMPPPGLGDTLAGGGAYLDLAGAIRELTEELRLLREGQATSAAMTADLVADAIRETLRGVGLADGSRRG